jgi:hypothetical protein
MNSECGDQNQRLPTDTVDRLSRIPRWIRTTIIAVIILVVVGLLCRGLIPYLGLINKKVTLHTAVYLRSPHSYSSSEMSYDPTKPLPAPEWVKLFIQREDSQAFFESSSGEKVRVELGKPYWVGGCENQYDMEAFPLSEPLTLGSLTFQQPVLVVVCDLWAAGEKIRPGRVVIYEGPTSAMQGPLSGQSPFFMGVQCNPGQADCLAFSEGVGDLGARVVDSVTGEALPDAKILISSGLGNQEFTGGFLLQVYNAMGVAYQVSLAGYEDKVGEIKNFYGNKLEVMYYTTPDHSQGMGDTLELTGYGQQVNYAITLSKK